MNKILIASCVQSSKTRRECQRVSSAAGYIILVIKCSLVSKDTRGKWNEAISKHPIILRKHRRVRNMYNRKSILLKKTRNFLKVTGKFLDGLLTQSEPFLEPICKKTNEALGRFSLN